MRRVRRSRFGTVSLDLPLRDRGVRAGSHPARRRPAATTAPGRCRLRHRRRAMGRSGRLGRTRGRRPGHRPGARGAHRVPGLGLGCQCAANPQPGRVPPRSVLRPRRDRAVAVRGRRPSRRHRVRPQCLRRDHPVIHAADPDRAGTASPSSTAGKEPRHPAADPRHGRAGRGVPAARRQVPTMTTDRLLLVPPAADSVRPDGPGRIAPGQRVTCLPGSLPARHGGRGGGILVSIGQKNSMVDVYGGTRRRIPNQLLHPDAGPFVAADRDARGLRTANASGRGWLPGWSWLGWTIAEHLEYIRGERRLPAPPLAPQRLVIVACGARKAACFEAPAGEMYVGSYHRAARRAADALTTPGTRVMILSARYGRLDMSDVILRYEMRLGHRFAITAQGLREQAEQVGLRDTAEVVVLAPGAYAELAAHVWPHAHLPLAGTCGIGEQMARLTALATGRTTVADLVSAEPRTAVPETTLTTSSGDEHTVSIRGGLVHLADTPPGRAGALAPMCPADQPGRRWRLTRAPITCTRCATIVARRRALDRWCAMVDRTTLAADSKPTHRDEPAGPASTEPKPAGQTGPAPCRPGTRSGR